MINYQEQFSRPKNSRNIVLVCLWAGYNTNLHAKDSHVLSMTSTYAAVKDATQYISFRNFVPRGFFKYPVL